MDETQKPFACTVDGCTMRFTNEDHLAVHKKKHDMVLNLGNGQKTNIFVADQTPTPTRFIRNCEEVGLFQDLQNVNPFEETFRKAVEATRGGSSHLEVTSLQMTATADDTLHTPHVFPNITEEHSNLSNLISSAPVERARQEKSPSPIEAEELEAIEVPHILHSSTASVEASNGASTNLESDMEISLQNSQVEVVKQEADTSQQMLPHASSSDSGNKLSTKSSNNKCVQVVLRMPDGQLVQLSGVAMGVSAGVSTEVSSGVSTGASTGMSTDETTGVSVSVSTDNTKSVQSSLQASSVVQATSLSQSTVISNIQLVQSPSKGTQVSASAQASVVSVSSSGTSVSSTSASGVSSQARLSAAKMKLKQRIQFNSKQKSLGSQPESSSAVQKKITLSRSLRTPSSDGSDSSVLSTTHGMKTSSASDELNEQRLRFRERNRAAAMRCREKRKHWILELEKRADQTQRTNQQLNLEIAKLRGELVQLKTLLLAHKDCSVTKAMQQGIGISIGGSGSSGKISPAVQLHVKSTPSAQTLPVTLQSPLNLNKFPDETSPKVVLLSKPSGLKRRRQAAAALTVSGSSKVHSKDPPIIHANGKPLVTVAQPITIATDSTQVSSSRLKHEVLKVVADNSTSNSQACIITVATPSLIPGVPLQHGVSLKPNSVTSTSYFIPPKIRSQSTDTLPHVIKVNPNLLKTEALQINTVPHPSGGDSSLDSGHGSDIEILADVASKMDGKS